MSWYPGLITRVGSDWMEVKVPTGDDCTVCPVRTACSFEGPKKAYRIFRMGRQKDYVVGDRVEVEEPASVLAVAALVIIAVPIVLLVLGYELTVWIDKASQFPVLAWVAGISIWAVVLFLANRWVSRSRRFQTRIRGRAAGNPG